MPAEILQLSDPASRRDALARAAALLADGGLVAFPTETVYGLAANAGNAQAIERLRRVKGRAAEQPFTVHIGRRIDAARFLVDPPPVGQRLMAKGWPGPLTLIFRVEDAAKTAVHASLSPAGREAVYRNGTVGLRCPDDLNAIELLTGVAAPIVASSANLAGQAPPRDAQAVADQLGDDIDLILDAGRVRYGRASTIVSLDGGVYTIVREGVFDARIIRRLAMLNILFVCSGNTCRSPMAEGLARTMLAKRLECSPDELATRGVSVTSCGAAAFGGMPVSAHAAEVCQERGVDISGHRSRPLTPDLLRTADHIFGMTRAHLDTIHRLWPEAAERAAPLDPAGDISDPVGGDRADYAACADGIARALELRLKDVNP
jgi:protein-tyrosine phosphatase